jgi:aryl-alcohol dehydrogenase-like predicted oxidoreductase
MKEHIKVCTGTSIQVTRLASLLEEEKIPFIIKNPIESGRLSGFGTSGESVELFVLNSAVEKAQKVLEGF